MNFAVLHPLCSRHFGSPQGTIQLFPGHQTGTTRTTSWLAINPYPNLPRCHRSNHCCLHSSHSSRFPMLTNHLPSIRPPRQITLIEIFIFRPPMTTVVVAIAAPDSNYAPFLVVLWPVAGWTPPIATTTMILVSLAINTDRQLPEQCHRRCSFVIGTAHTIGQVYSCSR